MVGDYVRGWEGASVSWGGGSLNWDSRDSWDRQDGGIFLAVGSPFDFPQGERGNECSVRAGRKWVGGMYCRFLGCARNSGARAWLGDLWKGPSLGRPAEMEHVLGRGQGAHVAQSYAELHGASGSGAMGWERL